MIERALRCLLVEDNPGDARLLREMLREAPPGAVELEHVTRMAQAEASLAARPCDVVLLDLGLPDSRDVESIQRVRAVAPGAPVVLLTGLDDELLAARAAREGASDYLVKGQVDGRGLVRTLRYAIERRKVEEQRDRLQAQLLHSQKLEMVGRVAGGIAHDLNNILSVILSTASLAADGLDQRDPLREDLEEIEAAGARASALTKKLLLFSRRDPAQPRNVDLGAAVTDLERMLRRLLGEEVVVACTAGAAPAVAHIDPGHLEQVVVNLAINARDAMPAGGRLSIETLCLRLDEPDPLRGELPAGEYVALRVTDTGSGIPPELRPRLFEPFFTTKAAGKGSGLGLSTVHGIVQQAGGAVRFETEVGRGTTFLVLLPRATGAPLPSATRHRKGPGGSGVVLVVEDDDALRRVSRRVLESGGYTVHEARSAGEAVLLAEDAAARIDVLLADLVLPVLDGCRLASRLLAQRQDLRVVFMSGYSEAEVEQRGLVTSPWPFVRKPFAPEALLAAMDRSRLLAAARVSPAEASPPAPRP